MTRTPTLKVIVYGVECPLLINVFTGKTAPPGDTAAMERSVKRTINGQPVLFHGRGWDVLADGVIDGYVVPWLTRTKKALEPGYKVVEAK